MTVSQIVKKYLNDNGFDGLYGDHCGCGLDDFMPCDGECSSCEPAYKHICPGADKCPDAETCESGGSIGVDCYGPNKQSGPRTGDADNLFADFSDLIISFFVKIAEAINKILDFFKR